MAFWSRLFQKRTSSRNTDSMKNRKDFTDEEPEEASEESDADFYTRLTEDAVSLEKEDEEEYEVVEREILPEKIVCPDCGGITLQGLEFCDKCGGELQ